VQVILNLVQNAVEAMAKNDPVRRKLSIASTRTAEGTIIVSVSDQGRGIPADLGEQPYMPLFTTKLQGMGLGLSICRSVVEAHNGRIWHDKNIDGGCSFHFSLPPETE
jgi:C4-dicarboxylate-specific signal transduction histidine kinase